MQETIQINEKQPRQNLSVADKEQYYRQWKQSGLSRSQFCREQKLSIATFCNWVKHFEERKSSVARESTFIPVTQISPVPTLEISLSNAVQIQKMVEENHLLNDKVACLEISLTEAKQKIAWFEEQLRLSRHRQFGNRSEALKTLQAEMIFNTDETPFACRENEAVADEVAIPILTVASGKAKVGRTLDLSQLPHQRQLHDLEDSEKTCQGCGQALHKIGEAISKQVEIIPRQLYVVEHVHPQYACRAENWLMIKLQDEYLLPRKRLRSTRVM